MNPYLHPEVGLKVCLYLIPQVRLEVFLLQLAHRLLRVLRGVCREAVVRLEVALQHLQ